MPFAVFRRHQRKLLTVIAILAMFVFVLSDSLPRLLSSSTGGADQNPVVVTLFNKPVYRSDLNEMAVRRNNANRFMELLDRQFGFGPINSRAIVDALILQHEADKLQIPSGPAAGREWLKLATGGQMNREQFEAMLSLLGNQVSGEQILSDIASQVRIAKVRQLLATPVVTPLDVYQTYRDQNERVSARMVPFTVDSFLEKIAEPTEAQALAYYEKYKNDLPDPARKTPGFKVPRQVRLEILSIDGEALQKAHEARLTEDELRTYYENHKTQYKINTGLPDDIFANDPRALLTPPQYQTFEDLRTILPASVAEEKATNEILEKLTKLKDEGMSQFADDYQNAIDEIADAKKDGVKTDATIPKLNDIKPMAKTEGFEYERTPLLSLSLAENYGQIHDAEVGVTPGSGGRKFVDEVFDPKSLLFEPIEFVDILKRRYLVRKIEDHEPRVPTFKEIRSDVNLAWKQDQARSVARKAAETYAEEVRKAGGTIKGDSVDGRKVLTNRAVPRIEAGFSLPGQLQPIIQARPVEFPDVPMAGEEFRNAYFGLQAGQVAVAPNEPETVYYVLALDQRIPATFATLYAPTGELYRFQAETEQDAQMKQTETWLNELRTQAGLSPDWVPEDESERTQNESAG